MVMVPMVRLGAFEDGSDAFDLLVELFAVACGEVAEWFDGSAGLLLMPYPGDDAVDEQRR